MRAPSKVIQWSWMEYCGGVTASFSSTDFTIPSSTHFAGNLKAKTQLYVIDIASVALVRGASASRFFTMPICTGVIDCNLRRVALVKAARVWSRTFGHLQREFGITF